MKQLQYSTDISLKGRPCGFRLRDKTFFFVRSLKLFVQSFLKTGQSLVSRLDKKQDSGQKKTCPVSEMGHFFFGRPLTFDIDWTIFSQETDQNHMDGPDSIKV